MEIKTFELGRGEICVANFIPPCQFAIGVSLKRHIRNKKTKKKCIVTFIMRILHMHYYVRSTLVDIIR